MKRRMFGLLASTSLAAMKFGQARGQTAKDPALLTTTLTPMGAERAGNADGSIPAWTGGCTTVPDGWQPGQYMPDLFADDQPIAVINASNMAQHADRLTDGVMALMTKSGFSIKVYPTRRTAAAPQSVYDNIAKNLNSATLNPDGPQLGFENAYGGVPFPIPDISNPLNAGAQIIWNHNARWQGFVTYVNDHAYSVNSGQVVLAANERVTTEYPYYTDGSLATFSGIQDKQLAFISGPPTLEGEQVDVWYKTNPHNDPNIVWQMLNGQGRVRKAPEIAFNTPSSYTDGTSNYDEYYCFTGSLEKYDWKYLGKKEMYIPYNSNAVILEPAATVMGPQFVNPDYVRWELHRVWVVEATLHPGERNVLARRRLYVDEDTWIVGVVDAWDANDNLYKLGYNLMCLRPDLPGHINVDTANYNLQTGNYVRAGGPFNEREHPSMKFYASMPESTWDPQAMAASSQY